MSGERRRPTHRLVLQHDADNEDSRSQTEVGALWPHERGGGFSITIKRGLAIAQLDGTRLHAFTIDHDAEDRKREERKHARDDERQRGRR